LILTATHARLVLAGRKTQIRVPVREPRTTRRRRKVEGVWQPHGPEYLTQPFQPKTGMRIPICVHRRINGTMMPVEECAVVVRDSEHQLLADLVFADALAEGHRTTDEFKAWWVRTHDAHWVLRSETGTEQDGAPDPLTAEQLADRFEQRWADRPVWAIRFVLDREQQPRYLASEGAGDERNYTANPGRAIDEPAAVDDSTLERFASDNRDRFELHTAADRLRERARTLAKRAREETLAAGRVGLDVTAELDEIDKQLRAIEFRRRAAQARAA
jgi:hypothetical protein